MRVILTMVVGILGVGILGVGILGVGILGVGILGVGVLGVGLFITMIILDMTLRRGQGRDLITHRNTGSTRTRCRIEIIKPTLKEQPILKEQCSLS